MVQSLTHPVLHQVQVPPQVMPSMALHSWPQLQSIRIKVVVLWCIQNFRLPVRHAEALPKFRLLIQVVQTRTAVARTITAKVVEARAA